VVPMSERQASIAHQLLWNDPISGSSTAGRSSAVRIGPLSIHRFLQGNSLQRVLRGHQNKPEGYETADGHEGRVTTVFSASAYAKAADKAAIAVLSQGGAAHGECRMTFTQWSPEDVVELRRPRLEKTTMYDDGDEVTRLLRKMSVRKVQLRNELESVDRSVQEYKMNKRVSRAASAKTKVELSGFVNVQQWATCMRKVFPKMNLDWTQMGEMLSVLGAEETMAIKGEINYQEVLATLDEICAGTSALSGMGPFKTLFRFMDGDQDGIITRAEFDNFWLPIRHELKEEGLYEDFMGGLDEYDLMKDLSDLFDTLDSDGDGKLTLDELIRHSF